MTTFTKEQLIEQAKSSIERYTKAVAGFPRHLNVAMELELARIALASLEAPAVMYASQETLDAAEQGEHLLRTLSKPSGDAVIPLYTSPPAPAVLDCFKRLLHHAYGMTMGHDWNIGTMAGHHRAKLCQAVDDCRAVMQGKAEIQKVRPVIFIDGDISTADAEKLAATIREFNSEPQEPSLMIAEPVSQPYKLPEGWVAFSEREPENKPGSYEYLVFETLNNGVHHDYWNVPDSGDDCQFTPFWNHYDRHVTHWMPLPAAPQQEVKP